MNLVANLQSLYEKVWQSIIMPSKQKYSLNDLGSRFSRSDQAQIERTDFDVVNDHGLKIKCSLYQKSGSKNISGCVVFCHGVSSSRIDGLKNFGYICDQNLGFCSFDFSGSGISEGEYVTYGLRESEDLECVIQELEYRFGISQFSLWGRSMGAVTVLNLARRRSDLQIKSIVLDSPFTTVSQIIQKIAYEKYNLASIGVKALLLFIQNKLIDESGYDIMKVDSKQYVQQIAGIACLILYSDDDKYIDRLQVEELFDLLASDDKELYLIQGDHNSIRSAKDIRYVQQFIIQKFSNTKGNNYTFRNINSHQQDSLIKFIQNGRLQNNKFNISNRNAADKNTNCQKPLFRKTSDQMGYHSTDNSNGHKFGRDIGVIFDQKFGRNSGPIQNRNQQLQKLEIDVEKQNNQWNSYCQTPQYLKISEIQSPKQYKNRIFEMNQSPNIKLITSPTRTQIESQQISSFQNGVQKQKSRIFADKGPQFVRNSIENNQNIYNQLCNQEYKQSYKYLENSKLFKNLQQINQNRRKQTNDQTNIHMNSQQQLDLKNQNYIQYTNHHQNIFQQKTQFN